MTYHNMKTNEFCTLLASSSPTPGGGGASALCGALAAALCSMVCLLTSGKEKYAEFEENTIAAAKKAEGLRSKLLSLINEDAEAFYPLSRVYAMPKTDPERAVKMEAALLSAALPPLEIMRCTAEIIELCAQLYGKSSVLAASDIGCASALAEAALKSAVMNVKVNTRLMKQREKADELDEEAAEIMERALALSRKTYDHVWSDFK